MIQTKFIIAITQHRLFGLILSPVLISIKEGQSFFNISDQLLTSKVTRKYFTDEQYQIITLATEYSENSLFKRFGREKNTTEFISNITPERIENIVRPFIEKKINQILSIAQKSDIQIYIKKDKFSSIHKADEVFFSKGKIKPVFIFDRNSEGIRYSLMILAGKNEVNICDTNSFLITSNSAVFVAENVIYGIPSVDGKTIQPFFAKKNIFIDKKNEKVYFEKFITRIAGKHDIINKGFEVINKSSSFTPILEIKEDLAGTNFFELSFNYDGKIIKSSEVQESFSTLNIIKGNYFIEKYQRNIDEENTFIEKLKTKGIEHKGDNIYTPENSTNTVYNHINWINQNNKFITSTNVSIKQPSNYNFYTGGIDISYNSVSRESYYEIDFGISAGNFKVPLKRIKAEVKKGNNQITLENDQVMILPDDFMSKYHELFQFAEIVDNKLILKNHHYRIINKTKQNTKTYKEFEPNKTSTSGLPKELKANLRHYQKIGYNWMRYLKKNNFGGCLADDMGLGKTIQTLSLLQKIKEDYAVVDGNDSQFSSNDANEKPVTLLVVPVSLIHNWENEIKKFTPGLKTKIYRGTNRRKQSSYFNYFDIIITSYGLIRQDIGVFENYNFEYIILDESQYIKNPESQIYKAVSRLTSTNKLVLTGTPIENNLVDLWAQLNFINPGILGSLNFFKKNYVTDIHKNKNESAQDKLKDIIEPFILRRKKSEVAKELPPVTEQIIWCEMDNEQEQLYKTEQSGFRASLFHNPENIDNSNQSFAILQALTKLRQVANHPRLIDAESNLSSGKFSNIINNLENILAEGHKVLIFSSFVKHLEIIEEYLIRKKHKYSKLTGKDRKREEIINEFTHNQNNKIFLVSLKAGGVGLNLTQADYVFILDPWWNPAAEDQAINRTHRIGQEKNVFVQRFITLETIEEKIQQLKEAKAELANTFINSNNPLATINKDELIKLFN